MDEPRAGRLSPTVETVAKKLGDAEVGVRELVEAVLAQHASDYAGGHAATIAVAWPQDPRRAIAQDWLGEVRELLAPEAHAELHGRAVILGAALADPPSGRAMVASGLFTAIAGDLRAPLGAGLTQAGRDRLGAIPITRAIAGESSTTPVASAAVNDIALSPSGALVAAGDENGGMVVLDRRGGTNVRGGSPLPGSELTLAFSRDGTRLATGYPDGRLLLSGPLGEPIVGELRLEMGGPFHNLRFGDGGTLAAIVADGAVVTIAPDLAAPSVVDTDGAPAFSSLSRDGRSIAWVTEQGTLKAAHLGASAPWLELTPDDPPVLGVTAAPGGARVAVGQAAAMTVYTAAGSTRFPTKSPVEHIAFDRVGGRVAFSTAEGPRFVTAGNELVELAAMPDVRAICFTRDGRWVAMVSDYGLRVDDVRTGEAILHVPSTEFTTLDVGWDRLVAGTRAGAVASIDIGLEPPPAHGIAAFNADGVELAKKLDVRLDIDDDVSAFASLVASTKVEPPLSIGLFGDWGSGKTFFMERLEARVNRLAREQTAASDPPFHRRIAQVKFNAWHYAEGNLWASLVQHLLANLALPGEPPSAIEVRKRELVEKIAAQDTVVEVSDQDAAELEKEVRRLKSEEEELERKAKASGGKAAALERKGPLPADGDAAEEARRALDAAGWPEGARTLEELTTTVGEASDVLRRSALLYRGETLGRRVLLALFVLAPLIGLAIGAYVARSRSDLAATLSGIGTAATAAIGAAVALIRSQLAWARHRLEKLERARAKLEAAEREHAEQVEAARAEAAAAQATAAEAREQRERLQDELEHLRPEKLLDELLAKRLESGAYRRHLGLLELVRGDFEAITDYLEASGDDGTGITRIVLYIDDLDRCEPERVVEVLKAVHLLLAMKLFVVVVGVDVRWVSGALDKRYSLLGEKGSATARDYLEKIFQIPFWIEPLDDDGTRGMLEQLLGDEGATAPATAVAAAAPRQRAASPTQPAAFSAAGPAAPAVAAPEPTVAPLPEERPEQLEIGELERAFMDDLAPLLGRSPRALKRFVNTYRIFKAREPDYAAFLSEGTDVADYRAVLFLLAVATGLPTFGAAFLDALVDAEAATVAETLDRAAKAEPEEVERLRAWLSSPGGSDWGAVPVAGLRTRPADVARFTFHWRSGVSPGTRTPAA